MAVTIGAVLGTYEITALLGKGGMGEVYRAKDKKLKREVAIKILPDEFSTDHDRLTRFQREAEVLASLNHPNIAAIYDLAAQDRSQFLVLELVDGETLADRIARGAIPVEEALTIAKQICEALEAAHEKGIIHRDLKPANIKLTLDGKVKVLDFGLARAYASQGVRVADLSNSPTMLSSASVPGLIMGTVAYMSPEQAKGKELDKRTDIFAFGCVLFEMLTGRKTFEGDDVSEIVARVLAREPDWALLPPNIPQEIRQLLRLCLEKNVKNRRSDASDVRIDIEMALREPLVADALPRNSRFAWSAAVVMTFAFVLLAAVYFSEKTPTAAPEMRLEISTPSSDAPFEFALSPDGRYIAFVASGDGPQRLWVRSLDTTEAQPIPGTDGATYPFWSADGRSIGFSAESKLKRVNIAGGAPQILANASGFRGGAWNADGTILFAPGSNGPLFRMAASGGEPVQLTKVEPPRQVSHRHPQFFPDGRHFLYYAQGTLDGSGIYLGSLDGGDAKRLTPATGGAYLGARGQDGMLILKHQTTLLAQHLDLKRGELTGDPITVADIVGTGATDGFSVSAAGLLAYRFGRQAPSQLYWYDRAGKATAAAGEPDSSTLYYPELSPDDRNVAVQRTIQNNTGIWLMDLLRGTLTRLTTDPAYGGAPVWSPDQARIAFASNRKGIPNLYVKPSSGIGTEDLLLETTNPKYPLDWSKDGRFLLYWEVDSKTELDLWALPLTGGNRKPIVIANTQFYERNGQFSPDGRWVAYETDESGRFEIEVQPFPNPSAKWQVSINGGVQPRWRPDGKELYFIAPDGKMMAAAIAATGAAFSASTPVALFPTHLAGSAVYKQQYAVSRDGRFLLNQLTESGNNSPITIIVNWHPEQKK